MKSALIFCATVFMLSASACKKEDSKTSGVCYCDFANGKKQEYNLTHLARSQQIDTCNNHNKNAGYFGGVCELK